MDVHCFVMFKDKVYDISMISSEFINFNTIFSSPVVCLCHGFMSVVDRAP